MVFFLAFLGGLRGAMKVPMNGREHLLTEGQFPEVPAGTPHTQVSVGENLGHVRIKVRPAGRTREFLEHVAKLCRDGKITGSGYPPPVAAGELILESSESGHATVPPLRLHRGLARLVPAVARPFRS